MPATSKGSHARPQEQKYIAVLGTGGTIASTGATALATSTYTVSVGIEDVVRSVPGSEDTICEQLLNVGSKDMTDASLLHIARSCQRHLSRDDVRGVVVTHGTDTIEETGYFLHLTLKTTKPVILVGAMRPGSALGADGPLNLHHTLSVARSPEAAGKGVLVVANGQIFSARDVTKRNTFLANALDSPHGALGYAVEEHVLFYRQPTRLHTHRSAFDIDRIDRLPHVGILQFYPGMDIDAQYEALRSSGARAIVCSGTGNANIPEIAAAALGRAGEDGIHVVKASRVGAGSAIRQGDTDLARHGWIPVDDQLPHKARILMMLGLTQTSDAEELAELFLNY